MPPKNSGDGAAVSRRPYLLRAMHEWISDSGHTPHVIVDALRAGVEVPSAYVKDGKIVLNLSMTATQRLQLKNDGIEFDARFAGVAHHVRVPMTAVLGVYARETGEGMIFSEAEGRADAAGAADADGQAATGDERIPSRQADSREIVPQSGAQA